MATPDFTTRPVYIYVLQRISDRAYLYTGSSINPKVRFNAHRHENPYKIVQQAFANDDVCFVVVSETDEEHRIEAEATIWQVFKDLGHPICNDKPRPYGGNYDGRKLSDETKQKISQASMGNKTWLGRHHSDESKRKQSESHRGYIPTEQARQRISAAHQGNQFRKGIPHDDETKKRIGDTIRGVKRSEEHRAKIAEANRKRVVTEVTKQKISAARKGKPLSEEHKQKITEGNLRRWQQIREEKLQCE